LIKLASIGWSMNDLTPSQVAALAAELAGAMPPKEASAKLAEHCGSDRRLVEQARDLMAARLHAASDDYEAAEALRLLNRCLADLPVEDPFDWRVRWSQRFRRP